MCILVLDDFWDTIKQYGSNFLSGAKDFFMDNKDTIHDLLGSVLSKTVP